MNLARTTAALCATAALAAPALQAQSRAQIGEVADFDFRTAPLNSMGVSGLEDLRGKPVLLEYWSTT